MNNRMKSLASVIFLLVFMLPALCLGGNRKLRDENVDSRPPVRSTAALGKYVFIDKHLTLHSSYDCKVFDTLYQVHIVDTMNLKKAYFFSYCSHCVALKQYERVKELTAIHHYKVDGKIEEVDRADVKDFLEVHPDAEFVKVEPAGYRSWGETKENAEKFPLLKKGIDAVKDKVLKK